MLASFLTVTRPSRGDNWCWCLQLCALPLQRTRELWRMYMTAFAEQLLKWQGDAQSPAALRLVSLQLTTIAHASV